MEFDPNFHSIEDTIDEFERRIKAEEARYSSLMANRQSYEKWMEPSDYRQLMRDSANRLINFDPNFDLPCELVPLPRPWLHQHQSGYQETSYNQY